MLDEDREVPIPFPFGDGHRDDRRRVYDGHLLLEEVRHDRHALLEEEPDVVEVAFPRPGP